MITPAAVVLSTNCNDGLARLMKTSRSGWPTNHRWLGLAAVFVMGFFEPAVAAEKFGGVEIGAKGIKASAVEIDTSGPTPTLKVLELDKQTVDLTISRLKGKDFKTVLIDDVATVVADFSKALQEKLGIPEANIQVVASSGVPFANNFTELVVAVQQKTGKAVDQIEAAEEAALTAMVLVPPDLRTKAMIIDIGSGNTKGGAFLDESGSREKFASIDVPFGTTTLSKAIDTKMEGSTMSRAEVSLDVAKDKVGEPLKSQMANDATLGGRDPVIFSGGSVWAFVTILKPETAKNPFPKVTLADIKAYGELINKTPGVYPVVDFSKVADPAVRKAAEADYARITGSTGDAPAVFKPAELQAGAALLDQVAYALAFQDKSVYFDRKAVTAWITAKITPDQYRNLLPAAYGRMIPVKTKDTVSIPHEEVVVDVKPSPQVMPSPQMVINSSSYQSFYGTAAIPAGPRMISRESLMVGKTKKDWESIFNRGVDAYRSADAQAIEYFAAAAELGDDPRSWTYLALSLLKAGDTTGARQAARYSAVKLLKTPGTESLVGSIFEVMQDPIRETLIQWQKEVRLEPIAQALREPRPVLCKTPAQGDDSGIAARQSAPGLVESQNK
jgi:hypothetical protein